LLSNFRVLDLMINILNWSEVWAPLIPLYIFILKKKDYSSFRIIAVYLLTALCINAMADVSWIFKQCMPVKLQNNNYLYNISSILRTVIFTLFFRNTINLFSKKLFNWFLIIYAIGFLIYFIINGNFWTLNSLLHTTESFTLLICSIAFFIKLINSEEIFLKFDPRLLIISGLALYESVNFFVFLFYQYIISSTDKLWDYIWYIPDTMYIVFCILIAKAFYGESKEAYEY